MAKFMNTIEINHKIYIITIKSVLLQISCSMFKLCLNLVHLVKGYVKQIDTV